MAVSQAVGEGIRNSSQWTRQLGSSGPHRVGERAGRWRRPLLAEWSFDWAPNFDSMVRTDHQDERETTPWVGWRGVLHVEWLRSCPTGHPWWKRRKGNGLESHPEQSSPSPSRHPIQNSTESASLPHTLKPFTEFRLSVFLPIILSLSILQKRTLLSANSYHHIIHFIV